MARRDRRRTTGALAASILVHLALFLMLLREAGSSPPTPQTRAGSDFQVQLVTQQSPASPNAQTAEAPPPHAVRRRPRPTTGRLPSPRPRSPPQRLVPASSPAPARRPPGVVAPAVRTGPPGSVAAAPAGAASTPGGAARGRWSVQGEDEDEGGVRRFLRATVGCSHEDYAGLSESERAACDRRIGQEARSMGIAPDKLAGFIAAAQAQERQRADRTGPMRDLFVPCTGEGSNLDRGCINMRPKHPQDEP